LAGLALAAVAVVVAPALPAGAQDLDCDSPGVGTDIPIMGDDPNGFDRDDDGVGCEADGSDGHGGVAAPADQATPAVNVTPPTTAPELAHTGAGTAVSTLVGLALAGGGGAALVAARHYRPRHLARRRPGA